MKLLFIVNSSKFFISHRLSLAIAAREAGFDVHIACPIDDEDYHLRSLGFVVHEFILSRGGGNFFSELRSFFLLGRIIWGVRPDLVHLISVKPIIYGGIWSRLFGVGSLVVAITGLGTIFIRSTGLNRIRLFVLRILYGFVFSHGNIRIIFQNKSDLISMSGLIASPSSVVMIEGVGLTLADYHFVEEPVGRPIVTFAGRLIADKGVHEFVEAAKIIKDRGLDIVFRLVGDPDPDNVSSINFHQLESWRRKGYVEVLGFRSDIPYVFSQSNIVVLPSYREGFPKVLMEAAACGRSVITTDVPGCRDAIVPNHTGLLVPAMSGVALADAIEILCKDDEMRKSFGMAGRKMAEARFSVAKVVNAHFDIYRELAASSIRGVGWSD